MSKPMTHPTSRHGRSAVIDIGSNSVRLAIFAAPAPDHRRLVNEKAMCRLVEGLDQTGKLSPTGVTMALDAIGGWVALAESLQVDSVQLVATAAVREASDGKQFTALLEGRTGHPVQILSGEDEATMSACGILSAFDAVASLEGLIVDLGGGSLELVELQSGVELGRLVSLPLGHIRLCRRSAGDLSKLDGLITAGLADVSWLRTSEGRKIFLAGGAFRQLARRHRASTVSSGDIDGYFIDASTACRFCEAVSGQLVSDDDETTRELVGARIVVQLVKATGAQGVVFSARGLMDGCHAREKLLEEGAAD